MHRLQWMRATHQRGRVQSLHHHQFESWGLAVARPGTQAHRPTSLQSLPRAGQSLIAILTFDSIGETAAAAISAAQARAVRFMFEPADRPTVSPNRGTGTIRSHHRSYGGAQTSGKPIR